MKYNSYFMRKPFSVLLQYILPQTALTALAGWLSSSQIPWLKNLLIRYFINRFDIDMQSAIIENPFDYPSFNHFFTRYLKPEARPIIQDPRKLACPVDGCISQLGKIRHDTLIQAKGFDFTLTNLLGGAKKHAQLFENGYFATLYLSPKDYHRVHMPIDGKLRETLYIPGNLFSVNQKTATSVPNLFARNERLVCLFDTVIGPMAIILVGAMIVGSINTVWHSNTNRSRRTILNESYSGSIALSRGDELGHFKLGSTVILLFAEHKVAWTDSLRENLLVRLGQELGEIYPD